MWGNSEEGRDGLMLILSESLEMGKISIIFVRGCLGVGEEALCTKYRGLYNNSFQKNCVVEEVG